MSDEKFPLSSAITESWAGHPPTADDKAAYWHAFAKDIMQRFKSPAQQLRTALKFGAWSFAKASKAESEIADLQMRLRALELRFESEQRGLGYKGVYREGDTYPKGAFCTHQGALWFAWSDTDARPGTDDSWQLAVKSPRK